ncbi:hypothetical protein [Sphingomonas jatrophae]|uniref:Uncharacterized protein n=1 Tax=Sphingomonas jatrophae TaxID=1166337 RepID=A0A1I6JVM0_9SPHN|nr:hypothetical protein [Sphingomonas jatrophae]SFR82986.1 hypothetical protein SAMN05192580_0948 [Sphingomonas jatrophae]
MIYGALAGGHDAAATGRVKMPMPWRVSMMAGTSLLLWSVILVPFIA